MTPPRSSDSLVTIVVVPCDQAGDAERLLRKGRAHHNEPHDELVVMVEPGRWREARKLIWEALGTTPWEPENVGPHGAQDGDYIRRAHGSL